MESFDLAHIATWYVAFVFAATAHEAAHAWAGMRMGDLTAYQGGQVSLNPLPHIQRSPLGMVVAPLLFLVMWGFPMGAASAPYDPAWANRYPKRAALMAGAGPASNMILLSLTFVLMRIGLQVEWLTAGTGLYPVIAMGSSALMQATASMLSAMFVINLVLALLNMFPVPPFDGSTFLGLFMSHEQALRWNVYKSGGTLSMIGLIVAFHVFGEVFRPVYLFLRALLLTGL